MPADFFTFHNSLRQPVSAFVLAYQPLWTGGMESSLERLLVSVSVPKPVSVLVLGSET
jgi:hypothetical protein